MTELSAAADVVGAFAWAFSFLYPPGDVGNLWGLVEVVGKLRGKLQEPNVDTRRGDLFPEGPMAGVRQWKYLHVSQVW